MSICVFVYINKCIQSRGQHIVVLYISVMMIPTTYYNNNNNNSCKRKMFMYIKRKGDGGKGHFW